LSSSEIAAAPADVSNFFEKTRAFRRSAIVFLCQCSSHHGEQEHKTPVHHFGIGPSKLTMYSEDWAADR
jgi:hypothetical protein